MSHSQSNDTPFSDAGGDVFFSSSGFGDGEYGEGFEKLDEDVLKDLGIGVGDGNGEKSLRASMSPLDLDFELDSERQQHWEHNHNQQDGVGFSQHDYQMHDHLGFQNQQQQQYQHQHYNQQHYTPPHRPQPYPIAPPNSPSVVPHPHRRTHSDSAALTLSAYPPTPHLHPTQAPTPTFFRLRDTRTRPLSSPPLSYPSGSKPRPYHHGRRGRPLSSSAAVAIGTPLRRQPHGDSQGGGYGGGNVRLVRMPLEVQRRIGERVIEVGVMRVVEMRGLEMRRKMGGEGEGEEEGGFIDPRLLGGDGDGDFEREVVSVRGGEDDGVDDLFDEAFGEVGKVESEDADAEIERLLREAVQV